MVHLRLITDRADDPTIDTAISTALLQRVADGDVGASLRLFTPSRIVAFGSQDRSRPGYAAAVKAVNGVGFAAVERLAGGTAAVFHEGTIAFAWSTPEADPKLGIEARYEAITSIVVGALARLGVDGAVGELPGEYCPGRFSVHAEGGKVMGVGQRLVKAGAHVGGVVVVHSPELVNEPLALAYDALGYDWNPQATGAVGGMVEDATEALVAAFSDAGHVLVPAALEPATLSLAASVADRHRPEIL